jgi:glutamate N-acetyltransferase/amino-acid N-acetyltransferase
MSVRYTSTPLEKILPVAGIRLGACAAQIKNWKRDDLLLIECSEGTTAAAVFTQNQFCAAPVLVDREHLQAQRRDKKSLRAVVVNAGNANAGTGAEGLERARQTCAEAAKLIGCAPEQIMVCSTGVILEPLPVGKILDGLPKAKEALGGAPANWVAAAKAIMTTDTAYKVVSEQILLDEIPVTITGIAKGAGMIHPNMATMLSFIGCDISIAPEIWQNLWKDIVEVTFNSVTVDGDTSTNDTMIAMATGAAAAMSISAEDDPRLVPLKAALLKVATHLAQALARDGEGSSKFMTLTVSGEDYALDKKVAFGIAHSPLVKTAFFASDPNLGRIICAVGNALPLGYDIGRVNMWLGDVQVIENGGRAASYKEEDGQRVMRNDEIEVKIDLGGGVASSATVWTCDLSHDYVTINAEYRT